MVRASRTVPAPAAGMISGTGATSASANSAIVAKRSAGDLDSARARARSTAAGTFGLPRPHRGRRLDRVAGHGGAGAGAARTAARRPASRTARRPGCTDHCGRPALGSALACSGLM